MGTSGHVSSRLLLAALFAIVVCVGCTAPRISAIPRAIWLDIDGDLGASGRDGPISGTTDMDDLGLDDTVGFIPKVELAWGPMHVGLTGLLAGFEGDGEATADLKLGNNEIEVGTDVETEVAFGAVSIFPTLFFVDGNGTIVEHAVNFQEREVLEAAIQKTLE